MTALDNMKAGPAFPFKNSIKDVWGNKTRKESIETSIQLILSTPKGSMVYNPELGSYVPLLVFDPLDDATINLLFYYTARDLEVQEPRIKVTATQILRVKEHHLRIWIGYIDVDDDTEQQYQTPIDFIRG